MDKIDDYSKTTEHLIPSRLSGKVGFSGIFHAGDIQANDTESGIYDVSEKVWIDTAEGYSLDLVGQTVGLERSGRDDETYRMLIKLKIKINIGAGEPELLIEAVKTLYTASTVHYIADYPAGVIVEHNGNIGLFLLVEMELDDGGLLMLDDGEPLNIREPDLASSYLLDKILPAGVSLEIIKL